MEEENIEGYAHVIIVSSEEAYVDKAAVAWKEAAKLADMAKQYANMMMFTAEPLLPWASDVEISPQRRTPLQRRRRGGRHHRSVP